MHSVAGPDPKRTSNVTGNALTSENVELVHNSEVDSAVSDIKQESERDIKQESERTNDSQSPFLNTFLDCVAVIFQVSLVAIFIFIGVKNMRIDVIWSVPLSIFLTSFRYWENYLGEEARVKCLNGVYDWLSDLSVNIRVWKVGNQLIASVWKIIVTFCLMPLLVVYRADSDPIYKWTVIL